jgi:predicted transposase YbfD/YdcC
MNVLKKCVKSFSKIPDHRVIGRCKYSLMEILIFVALPTIAGCNGWKEIHNFIISHAENFYRMLPGVNSIPGVDTLARTVATVDPACLANLLAGLAEKFIARIKTRKRGRPKREWLNLFISLDGKSLNGAIPRFAKKTLTHIVNAVCQLLTLAVEKVEDKSNEITALPLVIDQLHNRNLVLGNVLTIDAMGCQVELAKKITGLGGYYLFNLKNNQPATAEQVKLLFEEGLSQYPRRFKTSAYASPPIKQGGEIVQRTVTVVYLSTPESLKWFTRHSKWPGIKSLVKVRRTVEPTAEDKAGSVENRYYISSLTCTAKELHDAAVGHWSVETMHQSLDVAYMEDKCKVSRGNAPEILSIFRKLGLNLMNSQSVLGDMSKGELLKQLFINWEFLIDLLTKEPGELCSFDEVRRKTMDILKVNYGPIFRRK